MKVFHVCALALGACFLSSLTASAQTNYSNPISDLKPLTGYTADAHSDPRLLLAPDNNLWYSIFPNGTSYTTYRSPDLVSWPQTGSDGTTWPQTALSVSDLMTSGTGFWAAGIYAQKNSGVWTYYLYYTLLHNGTKSIGVATSTTGGHGYVDKGILVDGNTCPTGSGETSCDFYDAYVFQNPETGAIWLYFSDSMHALYARKLTSALNPASNGNTEPIKTADSTWHKVLDLNVDHQSWENTVMEHPTVVYFPNAANSGHRFQLVWNGAGGALPRYAIGAAYSGAPDTLFNKEPEGTAGTCGVSGTNPIMCMTQTSQVCSTGSPNIFIDGNNQWWMFYRARYGDLVSSANKCSTGSEDWNDRWVGMDKLYRDGTTDALTITPTHNTTQAGPSF